MYEYVICFRVTDLVQTFDPSTHYILVHLTSLNFKGLRRLNCMNLPSVAKGLKVNFHVCNCFGFLNSWCRVFWGSGKIKLIGTYFHVLKAINSR